MKEVDENERNSETYATMIHDEYIMIARIFLNTGMPDTIKGHFTNLEKFFPGVEEILRTDPLPLTLLAKQSLSTEITGLT